MHVEDGLPNDEAEAVQDSPLPNDPQSSRRHLLRLGALGAAAVVTIRPGLAQAAASVTTCTIPVPAPGTTNQWINRNGSLVSPNAANSYPPPSAPLKGVDVANAIKYGTSYPGYSYDASAAYTTYIKQLSQGTAGFTCFASIQNPGI